LTEFAPIAEKPSRCANQRHCYVTMLKMLLTAQLVRIGSITYDDFHTATPSTPGSSQIDEWDAIALNYTQRHHRQPQQRRGYSPPPVQRWPRLSNILDMPKHAVYLCGLPCPCFTAMAISEACGRWQRGSCHVPAQVRFKGRGLITMRQHGVASRGVENAQSGHRQLS
jgi:hypothetical protein